MIDELLLKDEVYKLVGAAMEVYNELGCGYHEPIYQEAYERELTTRNLPFLPQKPLVIFYKGSPLLKSYIPDLMGYEKVIVELKVLDKLTSREESQVINYLKASGLEVGLLLNFGAAGGLEWKRLVYTKRRPQQS